MGILKNIGALEIGIFLVVIIVIIVVVNYNKLVRLKNDVDEAFSTMDVYMKKRVNLITNLVETVKGYANHESDTLKGVTKARSAVMSSSNTEERLANENALSGTLKSLFAVSENYPDLKANTNFMDLQQQLQKVEEDIANARRFYNGVVKNFNIKCESFPDNLVAAMFRFKKRPMFQVEEEDRENVKVEF